MSYECQLKYLKSDKGKKAMKQYHKSEKGKVARAKAMRKMKLKQRYNITLEDFEKMKKEQNGVCRICSKPELSIKRGMPAELCVDHNHTTNKVRGLLCTSCNFMLGYGKEDISILQKGIEYIKEHSDYGLLDTVPFKEKPTKPTADCITPHI